MTTEQFLKDGTWIRSKVAVSDTGDHNERSAEAGALATIERIDGSGETTSYSVVFWPSFIQNIWDQTEILQDAEILPEGHPDIPSRGEYDFASAVADIVAEGEIDEDEGTVTAPEEVVARILSGSKAGRYAGKPEVAEILGAGGEEVTPGAIAQP
jgi:hypothetical protein